MSPIQQAQHETRFTRREREILALIAEGCGNKEIAVRLGMRLQTVKSTVSVILSKAGVKNRVQLALCVISAGRARDPVAPE